MKSVGTLKIYQLKSGDENRYRRWMNYDSLRKMGEMPRLENYEQVYFKQLLDNPTPEQVYWQFNQTRPADFIGHSLSTSDIIVFQSEVETIALYVDNVGYTRLPDLEKELAAAEKTPRICLEIGRKVTYKSTIRSSCRIIRRWKLLTAQSCLLRELRCVPFTPSNPPHLKITLYLKGT